MGQKISDALMGCFEIPIFIKTGVNRFDPNLKAAQFSFIVPVLLLPVTAYLAGINPDFKNDSFVSVLSKFTFEFVIFSVLYLCAIYLAAKQLSRSEFFLQFVNAQNWLSLTQVVIMLPVLLGVMTGHWQWSAVYNFLIFLIVYGYVYQAFLITYIFRINWMLAAALSILGMAISDTIHTLIY